MMNFDPAYFFTKTINIGSSENQVTTHLSFTKASARIAYKTQEGVPYANKKVSWEVNGVGKQPIKGRGTTDQSGIITIPLPQNPDIANPSLATSIEIASRSLVSNTFPLKSAYGKLDLQFFPEGGDIIQDVPAKIAFKTLKADGLGIEVKGNIVDNEGKIVVDFASQHLGMGAFTLLPEPGKTYTAKLTSPAGYAESYSLPAVKASGIKLAVTNSATAPAIGVRFICNSTFFTANQNKSFYLVAKVGETICYAAQTVLQKQLYTASIPKDKFPTGIVQISLLASSGEVMSERITFVKHPDDLGLALKTDKPTYGRRQKVKLNITAKNGTVPAEANLSVSVIDESKVHLDENAETTILSNLLLTSDLKGYIEKPNYYFNRPNDKTAADLDVLMLTQGYRRFTYKDILSKTPPQIFLMPEQGIEITGTLRTSTGMPIFKGNVRLAIPDKSITTYAVTNSNGVFRFPNVVIADSLQAVITSADYRYKNPMLTIDPMILQPGLSPFNTADEQLNIDSTMEKYLVNNRKIWKSTHQLKEVVITAKAPSNAPSHADYPTLSGLSMMPDRLIKKEQFANCPIFMTCLQASLTGVTYREENFYISRDLNAGNTTPMQVFYNGMPVDANYVNSINPTDIESVEVFLKDELGLVNRANNSNGVIVINGKKVEKAKQMSMEEIRRLLPKPGEIKFIPQGYSLTKEFYSPKYLVPQSMNSGNDLRTTIYWNPKIKTDKATGLSAVEFYNADGRGTYTAIVEGIDAEGHIGRSVYKYKVE